MNRQISSTMNKSNAFTLIELLVVVAVIAILMALLFPVGQRMLDGARSAECMTNQRSTGIMLTQYASENGNRYPHFGNGAGDSWTVKLAQYSPDGGTVMKLANTSLKLPTDPAFFCPAHKNKVLRGGRTSTDFAVNISMFSDSAPEVVGKGRNVLSLESQSKTLVLIDGADDSSEGASSVVYDANTLAQPWPYVGAVHNGNSNLLFVDGHVESRKFPDQVTDVQMRQGGELW